MGFGFGRLKGVSSVTVEATIQFFVSQLYENLHFHVLLYMDIYSIFISLGSTLTILHSEKPKLYTILALLSAIGLKNKYSCCP